MSADSRRKRRLRLEIPLGLVISLLLHASLLMLAPGLESRTASKSVRPRPKPKVVPVALLREKARLIAEGQKAADEALKALLAEKAKPKPEEKTPEPPKPKKKPKRKKKKKKTSKPPAKPTQPPKETPSDSPKPPPKGIKAKPAPFVLSNVSLSGGVAVQTGSESNLFGDPDVDARGWKKDAPDAPRGDPNGADSGTGEVERRVVIKPPRALNKVKGRYPDSERDRDRIVRVELMLRINAEGRVSGSRVVNGDLEAFNSEASSTVLGLRFSPATRDGRPIAYELKWTVVFIPESR